MPTGNNGSNIMKTRNLVMSLVVMMFLASCGATQNSVVTTGSTARILEPETPELVADLEVANMKVTGEFKYECPTDQSVNEQEFKDNAVYNALQPVNADVLVAPQYHVVKEVSSKKYYTVTVTGYPAFYRNFRPVPVERVTNIEFKEVGGLVFLVTKNNFDEAVGYQIVVPSDKKAKTMDVDQTLLDNLSLDQVALDQVILKAREGYVGAKVTTNATKEEKKEGGLLSKVVKAANKKAKKNSKTKK